MTLPDHIVKNPASLVQALTTHRVTHVTAVPTLLQSLVSYLTPAPLSPRGKPFHDLNSHGEMRPPTHAWPPYHNLSSSRPSERQSAVAVGTSLGRYTTGGSDTKLRLKVVVSSGEPLTLALAQALTSLLPHKCHLLNLYGCTEAAADCTCFDTSILSTAGYDLFSAPDPSLHVMQSAAASPNAEVKAATSALGASLLSTCSTEPTAGSPGIVVKAAVPAPGFSLHSSSQATSTEASCDASVTAATSASADMSASTIATSAPTAAQHAQHGAHTGRQLSTSALIPCPALPAAQTSAPASTAASTEPVREGVATASIEQTGVDTQAGVLSQSSSRFPTPLTGNPQVAVGWPLDGFALCILAMTTALQKEKLPGKLPQKHAIRSSSNLTSPMLQHTSEHVSQHELSPAKKRKIGPNGHASEAGPSESLEPAEKAVAPHMGHELADTVSIVEAGVVGEVAVAGTGLALGYHRYGLRLTLCCFENDKGNSLTLYCIITLKIDAVWDQVLACCN